MAKVLTRIEIEPLVGPLGAKIGIARDDVMNPGVAEQVMAAVSKYGVLIFPEIGLTDDQFCDFGAALGERHSQDSAADGTAVSEKGIYRVTKDKDQQTHLDFIRGNDYWHTDGTAYQIPDKCTLLKCEVPMEGADTDFADLFAAWNAMPQDFKDRLEPLRVIHCLEAVTTRFYDDPTEEDFERWDAVFPKIEHPLVWHQKDGRTSIIVGATAFEIAGMDHDEGAALLEELVAMCTTEQFTYRHKWTKGDMVMFNNPGLLHRSLPYGRTSGRTMHRTTIKGTEMIEG